MALSAFTDRSHPPGNEDLQSALGKAHVAWTHLIELATRRVAPLSEVWGFTSAGTGWGLRLKRGERVICYMTPGQGKFLVSFALGEKAVAAATTAGLAGFVLEAIAAAPRYAEGRGVRFEVRHRREAAPLAALAQIKNEH
jgi:hypothetical protein